MKKIALLLIGMLVFSKSIFAQNIGKNNEKYWYYRERLKWFMIGIGPNAGQSMPAGSRSTFRFTEFPRTNPDNTQAVIDLDANGNPRYIHGLLSVNDNLNELGWYIGVLATEWKLLHDEGSDTRNTEKELFYALYALRRLDNSDFCLQQNRQSLHSAFSSLKICHK